VTFFTILYINVLEGYDSSNIYAANLKVLEILRQYAGINKNMHQVFLPSSGRLRMFFGKDKHSNNFNLLRLLDS
jgi:hypothetical protein